MDKRDLKAFSRFDGTGRIVPGSTVLRRNKPKNGNWKEVQAYECCNPTTTTTTSLVYCINCQLYRNDTEELLNIEGYACGENISADHELNPGDTVCMQIVIALSNTPTDLGPCGPTCIIK